MTTELMSWQDYLRPNNLDKLAACCHQVCSRSFERQRTRLLLLWERLKPENVLFLGAGGLNDLPIRQFLEAETRVTLVDWVPGIIRAGLAREMVYGPPESPACIVCRAQDRCPTDLCGNYFPYLHQRDVCLNFKPNDASGCRCANYCPGSQPQIVEQDVSGSIGQQFAESVLPCLNRAPNSTTALSRLRKTLCAAREVDLCLPTASFDLVISTMVVSQFYFEPLQYMTQNLLARYPISDSHRDSVESRLQELRRILFTKMLAGHFKEIKRLLKPGGRAYVSFEICHRKKDSQFWFVPDYTGRGLAEISRRFLCSFDVTSPAEAMTQTETCEGESVILSFLLSAA